MNNNIKLNVTIIIIMILSIILKAQIVYATRGTTISNGTDNDNYIVDNELSERDKETGDYLQSLTIEGYDIYPEFNKNTTTYYAVIPATILSLNITAIPESENATTKITGNTNLTKSENTIKITVIAQSKATKTYSIIVSKQEDNGLKLLSLNIENVNLSPEFYSENYHYTADVFSDTEYTDVNIYAEANNPDANIEIIGNKNLTEGEHLIAIILKDGKVTTTYEILANITKSNTVTTTSEENENFLQVALNKIEEFFSDSLRVIIFLSAIAILLLILVIITIVKITKNKKANKNRKKIKDRVK